MTRCDPVACRSCIGTIWADRRAPRCDSSASSRGLKPVAPAVSTFSNSRDCSPMSVPVPGRFSLDGLVGVPRSSIEAAALTDLAGLLCCVDGGWEGMRPDMSLPTSDGGRTCPPGSCPRCGPEAGGGMRSSFGMPASVADGDGGAQCRGSGGGEPIRLRGLRTPVSARSRVVLAWQVLAVGLGLRGNVSVGLPGLAARPCAAASAPGLRCTANAPRMPCWTSWLRTASGEDDAPCRRPRAWFVRVLPCAKLLATSPSAYARESTTASTFRALRDKPACDAERLGTASGSLRRRNEGRPSAKGSASGSWLTVEPNAATTGMSGGNLRRSACRLAEGLDGGADEALGAGWRRP
mmetsp:Transcript_17159/g.44004  ORF Transcript_17159/g.44004 Transcript_17159/m.44004 type:complete len:351 (+) Transcript_17159:754-1806(+)